MEIDNKENETSEVIQSGTIDDFVQDYFRLRPYKYVILNYLQSTWKIFSEGIVDIITGIGSVLFTILSVILFPFVLIVRIPFLWKFGSNTRQILKYRFKYQHSKSASKLINLQKTLIDIKKWKIDHGKDGKMVAYNWIERFVIKEITKAEKREGCIRNNGEEKI